MTDPIPLTGYGPETSVATQADRLLAPRDDVVDDLFGRKVPDPYRWLENADDPRTQAWSAVQDRLFAKERDGWPGRDRLRAHLSELLKAGMISAPVWRDERQFFMRR